MIIQELELHVGQETPLLVGLLYLYLPNSRMAKAKVHPEGLLVPAAPHLELADLRYRPSVSRPVCLSTHVLPCCSAGQLYMKKYAVTKMHNAPSPPHTHKRDRLPETSKRSATTPPREAS